MDDEKEYTGSFRIGAITKSYDTESEEECIVETNEITEDIINQTAKYFMGEIEQVPPIFSAIKQNGKPVYKLARKGTEVKLLPRKVTIRKFDVKKISDTEVEFTIICSKGTYIRSIANDFGKKIGVGAYLKTLQRTRIGSITLDNLDANIGEVKFRVLN